MASEVVEPVSRGASKSIQGLPEFPVGTGRSDGAAWGRSDYYELVVRESGLTKRVLAVPLFEDTPFLYG